MKIISLLAATALAATSVAAQAAPARPASAMPAVETVAPKASVRKSTRVSREASTLAGGALIGVIAGIAIIGGILIISSSDNQSNG